MTCVLFVMLVISIFLCRINVKMCPLPIVKKEVRIQELVLDPLAIGCITHRYVLPDGGRYDFFYITWHCTLEVMVKRPAEYHGPAIDDIIGIIIIKNDSLWQAANGLEWLHTRNVSKKHSHMRWMTFWVRVKPALILAWQRVGAQVSTAFSAKFLFSCRKWPA